MTLLFYPETRPGKGFGHVMRSLALAKVLRHRGHACAFACHPPCDALVRESGIPVHSINDDWSIEDWLLGVDTPVMIGDYKTHCPEVLRAVATHHVPFVLIDNLDEDRLHAQLCVYPNAHFDVESLDWDGFTGQRLSGPEFVLLHPDYLAQSPPPLEERSHVLITMGGSDPNQLTLRAMDAIATLPDTVAVTVVVGKGFAHRDAVLAKHNALSHRCTLHDSGSLLPLIAQSGLVITAVGMTIYECATQATPVVVVCNFETDLADAQALHTRGGVEQLGLHSQLSQADFAHTVTSLWQDFSKRKTLSTRIQRLVNGNGTARIADAIEALV